MASRNGWKELVLPCIAMVAVECSTVIATILIKAASVKGMSYFVFTAYCYILGTLVFLLLVSLFKRKSVLPQLKFPLFSRIFLIGLFGFSGQLCMYKGLQLSSPTLASAISNLTPAFTFILAVFFRPLGLMSSESNWIIGGLLLAVAFVLVSLGYIIQSQIMKIYPEEVTVNFFYNLFGTIISLPICFLAEPNLSSWRLSSDLAAVAVLYSGLFGFSFLCVVHIWGIHLKGPVFVASFKPTSIAIAVVMSAIFLGEAIFLGSVIGSLILCKGLYCVLWGKAKEEEEMRQDDCGLSTTINGRVPLLQSQQS
ncbi:hypothetical protein Gotur_009823 [Gossypium turneri]